MKTMFETVGFFLGLVFGSVVGWWMVLGFCSIPGVRESVVCGHNYWVSLIFLVPVGWLITWYTFFFGMSYVSRAIQERKKNS